MKTERTKELLARFKDHGVSHAPENGLKYVLEYQDCIGHASYEEIYEFYEGLSQGERELFFWANGLTLSYDMAISIMKRTVIANFKRREQEGLETYFVEEHKKIDEKKETFEQCRKHVWKRIENLRKENAHLKARRDNAEAEKNGAWKHYYEAQKVGNEYKVKAEKYDALKASLA